MGIEDTDRAAEAARKPGALRVSLKDIEGAIAGVFYQSGDCLFDGAGELAEGCDFETMRSDAQVLTLCTIVMRNGFMVIGKTAPADPTNFNIVLGKKFAYEDAIRQIWPLMGFELKSKLLERAGFGTGPVTPSPTRQA